MGAFGSGFLQAIGQAAHQKATDARAQDQKLKDQRAQAEWDSLTAQLKKGGWVDGSGQAHEYTDDDRKRMIKETSDTVSKLYGGSKPVKEIFQKVQQIAGQMSGQDT